MLRYADPANQALKPESRIVMYMLWHVRTTGCLVIDVDTLRSTRIPAKDTRLSSVVHKGEKVDQPYAAEACLNIETCFLCLLLYTKRVLEINMTELQQDVPLWPATGYRGICVHITI